MGMQCRLDPDRQQMFGQIKDMRGRYTLKDSYEHPYGGEILYSLLDLGMIVILGDLCDPLTRVESTKQYNERNGA